MACKRWNGTGLLSTQKYAEIYLVFKTESKHVKIADWEHYDVQQLLKESAFLITDYSSIFNDFAYMKTDDLLSV